MHGPKTHHSADVYLGCEQHFSKRVAKATLGCNLRLTGRRVKGAQQDTSKKEGMKHSLLGDCFFTLNEYITCPTAELVESNLAECFYLTSGLTMSIRQLHILLLFLCEA